MVGRGTYSGININKSGTASAPITVRAADPGQVRVTGGSNIGGNYVVVEGFIFDDASVVVSGDYSRFTRNVVINMSRNQGMTVIITGSFNRVDHNELANIAGRGISIKHDQGKGAGMRSNRIDYNYLHDWVGPPGQNTHEGIQVGTHNAEDHDIMRGHIVEYNLLENVNIENETICIKSSGSMIRFNTIKDSSRGMINNRHGQRNTIMGNCIQNSRGIGVDDIGIHVVGNRTSTILVRGGDAEAGGFMSKDTGNHPNSVNALIEHNYAGSIQVGDVYSGDTIPARNTVLRCNQGRVSYQLHVNTQVTNCPTNPPVQPVCLTAADVGPAAPDPSCATP